MASFYEHSGATPILGLVLTIAGGLVGAVALACAYSYGDVYIPIVVLNVLLTGGFGFCMGWGVAFFARLGHVRNTLAPAVIAAVSGCVGLYVAWGVDRLARVGFPDDGDILAVFAPHEMARYIRFFYDNGFWSLNPSHGGGQPNMVSGIPLAIVWLVEAGAIVGIAAWAAHSWMHGSVYCERCQGWVTTQSDVCRIAPADISSLQDRVANGDLAPLADAPRAEPTAKDYLRLDLACCDICHESNYLTLSQITTKLDRKKKETVTTEVLIDRLAIKPGDVPVVRAAGRVAEPASDPAASPPSAAS
jgi:hypothetical protein